MTELQDHEYDCVAAWRAKTRMEYWHPTAGVFNQGRAGARPFLETVRAPLSSRRQALEHLSRLLPIQLRHPPAPSRAAAIEDNICWAHAFGSGSPRSEERALATSHGRPVAIGQRQTNLTARRFRSAWA